MHRPGDARGDDERDQGPGRELEEQQLDGQDDGGKGRAERRRHARGGTAGEEDLAFGRRDPDHLAEERADGARR